MSKPAEISLIFKTASELQNKEDRLAYLRNTYSEAMQRVIEGAYHPAIVWLLPKGNPPYTPSKGGADIEYMFYKEYKKLYLFCKGGNDDLKQSRREALFIQLLESIHPEDAKLLLAIKDKYIPYSNLSYEFFQECFPGILPEREISATIPVVPNHKTQISEVKEEKKLTRSDGFGKGMKWFNDGKKNVRLFLEDGKAKGFTLGRL